MTLLSLPPRPKILIIRRDNIGDLVCTTPAIAALRLHYPDAEIAALVNSYNAGVLHGNPNLDRVFVYQKLKHAGGIAHRAKAIAERLGLITRLRRWNPDVTILAKSSYERHGLNFARLIGARNIIGFEPSHLSHIKRLPDIKLLTPEFSALHEVESVNLLLTPLGINDALGPLHVLPNEEAVSQLRQMLPAASKRIALHISAREPERRWGNDNFIALTKYILESQPETQILLFWSPGKANDPHHPGDDESAELLLQAVQSNRIIPMPTESLTELIAMLSLCDLFVGADGGAMHLAVALNKKVLAMFENKPDKLCHWYPWRVTSKVVHGSASEISSLPLDTVLAALAALEATT